MILMNVYYLVTKDACCHCRSVYGIPTASNPEVTHSFVIASFPSCSWCQHSCTGFQKVSWNFHQWLQIHRYASLVPRPCPAHFSWPHVWPLNCPTSPGCSKITYAVKKTEQEMAWERGYAYARVAAVGSRAPRILCIAVVSTVILQYFACTLLLQTSQVPTASCYNRLIITRIEHSFVGMVKMVGVVKMTLKLQELLVIAHVTSFQHTGLLKHSSLLASHPV